MSHFIFCHGFGFDDSFWRYLMPYFSKEKCSLMNLGYFNQPCQPVPQEKMIGIGHSLGLLKLICTYQHFDYLIGLNSFINFLSDQADLHSSRKKACEALKWSFACNPAITLKHFYERCGLPDFIKDVRLSDLNLNAILSDLESLMIPHQPPAIPLLILSSDHDVIVPHEIIKDNFENQLHTQINQIGNADHALGFKQPALVYNKIMRFLDETTT